MKKVITVISIALLFVLSNCAKKEPTMYHSNMQPFTIKVIIKKDNLILPDSILEKVRMSYMYNGVKHYVSDFNMGNVYGDSSQKIVSTFEAYLLSSVTNRPTEFDTIQDNIYVDWVPMPKSAIFTYHIEYPNDMKTDTMHLVTTILDGAQAMNNPCGCIFPPTVKLQFNGKPALLDTSIRVRGYENWHPEIYLLEK